MSSGLKEKGPARALFFLHGGKNVELLKRGAAAGGDEPGMAAAAKAYEEAAIF